MCRLNLARLFKILMTLGKTWNEETIASIPRPSKTTRSCVERTCVVTRFWVGKSTYRKEEEARDTNATAALQHLHTAPQMNAALQPSLYQHVIDKLELEAACCAETVILVKLNLAAGAHCRDARIEHAYLNKSRAKQWRT